MTKQERLDEVIDEMLEIINDRITITDHWGGEKIANWKYKDSLILEGSDQCAETIAEMFVNEENDSDMLGDLVKAEQIWREWHNAGTNPPSSPAMYDALVETCTNDGKLHRRVMRRMFDPRVTGDKRNGWFSMYPSEIVIAWRLHTKGPTDEELRAIGLEPL